MKILIIGKNGQVGFELCRTCATLGKVAAVDLPEIDLARPDSIRSIVREKKPAIIINAAAYTAVDKAESEPELAMAINGIAPGVIAEEAKQTGAALIHFSTDYVFDGEKNSPYLETDEPNPLSVYGRTKLAGDRAIESSGAAYIILRTSWIYGWRGDNFLRTMLRLAQERDEIRVVNDQVGAPTWSMSIAEATAQIVAQSMDNIAEFFRRNSGVYNVTSQGKCTWYEFAKEIFAADPRGLGQKHIKPISTAEYPAAARRPRMSLLDNSKLERTFGLRLPDWKWPLELWHSSGDDKSV